MSDTTDDMEAGAALYELYMERIAEGRELINIPYLSIENKSPKAYQIKFSGGLIWLPKSQVELTTAYIKVPRWLAEKKELI